MIVRPAFILGGGGTGIAHDRDRDAATSPNAASPRARSRRSSSSAASSGWKEYELEVMRDHADNVVVICSIENLDPMGVHTGESITVAPAQTLTDVEYQQMRDAAFACIRRIGVETGGSNVQFAVHPRTGEQVIIEMNPRVSRSSRAREQGDRLPDREDRGQARGRLPPRRGAERHHARDARELRADDRLRRHEVPALGVREAAGRGAGARHADAVGRRGDGDRPHVPRVVAEGGALARDRPRSASTAIRPSASSTASATTSSCRASASRRPSGCSRSRPRCAGSCRSSACTRSPGIDPWFCRPDPADRRGTRPARAARLRRDDARRLAAREATRVLRRPARVPLGRDRSRRARRRGSRPACASRTRPSTRARPSSRRTRRITTAPTRTRTRSRRSTKPAVVILGSGPNRIGQGVEFDYCCVHAAFALRDAGFETVMVNCNPETVSTDYDTSDRLFFEPLTEEDVLNVCERAAHGTRASCAGVIVTLGGQTPLKLAHCSSEPASRCSAPVPASIDAAEDREQFNALCDRLGIPQPDGGTARDVDDARRGRATRSAIRCSSGRRTCSAGARWRSCTTTPTCAARWASSRDTGSLGREGGLSAERPALIDRFLEDAVEVDVDALRDRTGEVRHRRRDGAHRRGRRALRRLRVRDPAADARRRRRCGTIEEHTRALADALERRRAAATCSTR